MNGIFVSLWRALCKELDLSHKGPQLHQFPVALSVASVIVAAGWNQDPVELAKMEKKEEKGKVEEELLETIRD